VFENLVKHTFLVALSKDNACIFSLLSSVFAAVAIFHDSLNIEFSPVIQAQTIIAKARVHYWKLKAVDTLDAFESNQLPKEEYNKIINALIDNEKVKEGLIIKSRPIPSEEFPAESSYRTISKSSFIK